RSAVPSAHRSGFDAAANDASHSRRPRELGESEHLAFDVLDLPAPRFAEGGRIERREHGDSEHAAAFSRALDGRFHHRPSTGRMHRDQARAKRCRSISGRANRVRDVVVLEVAEHVAVSCASAMAHLAHHLRPGRSEELAPHLHEIARLAEPLHERCRLARAGHIQRDDGSCSAHDGHSSVPTSSPTDRTPCVSHHRARSRTTRSGSRGSRSAAVPIPTSDAPAMMYCKASDADDTPPTPSSGTRTACRTFHVASTPTGSNGAPLTPPDPKPNAGRRRSTSTMRPGIVFTSVIPSAPASTATQALAAMSGDAGLSLTKSGRAVAARAPRTTAASVAGSAPNSMPPARTFGQLTLSSNTSTPASSVSAATTAA